MKGQWSSESFETLCHATYAARSSADVRIVGADVSVINMIHVAVVLLLAVLLISYVDEGLLQNSGRGSLLLQFEKVALSNCYLAQTRNHEDGFCQVNQSGLPIFSRIRRLELSIPVQQTRSVQAGARTRCRTGSPWTEQTPARSFALTNEQSEAQSWSRGILYPDQGDVVEPRIVPLIPLVANHGLDLVLRSWPVQIHGARNDRDVRQWLAADRMQTEL